MTKKQLVYIQWLEEQYGKLRIYRMLFWITLASLIIPGFLKFLVFCLAVVIGLIAVLYVVSFIATYKALFFPLIHISIIGFLPQIAETYYGISVFNTATEVLMHKIVILSSCIIVFWKIIRNPSKFFQPTYKAGDLQ